MDLALIVELKFFYSFETLFQERLNLGRFFGFRKNFKKFRI